MRVEWAFLAQSALGTKEGIISALGIGFDTFPSFPVTVVPEQLRSQGQVGTAIRFSVVLRALAKRVEVGTAHDLQIIVSDADGGLVTRVKSSVVPQPNPNLPPGWDQPILGAFDINVLPKSFGHYTIDIIIDNDHKANIPFRIVQVQPPGLPAA